MDPLQAVKNALLDLSCSKSAGLSIERLTFLL